ncbi:nucleotidyltransferase domain-containing protein [Candidatus Gottesmanbacteria bacterium]|nr:nucleotidyltransferase domain-containing protein [Candidatus Gottesmanbacteria bacterium]
MFDLVHQYGLMLQRAGISYTQLIVFGSQAKGSAHSWSDIDVCVVSDRFGKDRHTERVTLMRARRSDVLLDIEPHPYHPNDLEDKYDPLACEIRTYGIQVA